jgi:hypothetical protein
MKIGQNINVKFVVKLKQKSGEATHYSELGKSALLTLCHDFFFLISAILAKFLHKYDNFCHTAIFPVSYELHQF